MGKIPVFFLPSAEKESPEAVRDKILQIYRRIGINETVAKEDFAAVKIHFGEKGNKGHIKPPWIRGVIDEVRTRTERVFLTDTNTLYTGPRSNAVDHIRLAWKHGFTAEALGVPVIIADGLLGRDKTAPASADSPMTSRIAPGIRDADVLICLSHITGHVQTGVGGAIKNLGMGCASRAGKLDQHSVVHPRINPKLCRNCSLCLDFCPEQAIVQAEGHVVIDGKRCIGCGECLAVCKRGAVKISWHGDARRVQEKMAEYARLVQKNFEGRAAFINVLIRVTKDCDCMSRDQPRIVEDIGILGSRDPVAVDKASIDLVLKTAGSDVFRAGYDIDWEIQLRRGEDLGLGRRDYELVSVD